MDKPEPPKTAEELTLRVAGMLISGARVDQIQDVAKAEKWKHTRPQVRKAVKAAEENFIDILGVDQTTALGTALARLNHILAKSLQIQDYKTAFSIQNEITGLLLSSPDVILGPDEGPKKGRPLKDVNADTVYGMAVVGASNVEIAQVCGVSEGTIRERFAKQLELARANMKKKLRRAQIAKALEGNPTMLIWLGKQMLGQKERTDITTGDEPIPARVLVEFLDPEPDADGDGAT